METQSALIGTDSAVELYTVADVDMYFSLVVHPRHTEGDDALRFDEAFDDFGFFELRMLVIDILDGDQNFAYACKYSNSPGCFCSRFCMIFSTSMVICIRLVSQIVCFESQKYILSTEHPNKNNGKWNDNLSEPINITTFARKNIEL